MSDLSSAGSCCTRSPRQETRKHRDFGRDLTVVNDRNTAQPFKLSDLFVDEVVISVFPKKGKSACKNETTVNSDNVAEAFSALVARCFEHSMMFDRIIAI
ncbi:hypothetical protein E3U25_01015 (plasmid) [Paracoccus versutus]|uniref:hypothetical protein n=1 Tax=Paracoccus versutus TaxID=34007 RepID=UPI0011C017BA|nr:hypothetical protein [Paracoccus versutus]WGR54707.1 hypothetical protein E3U25_01015 [Paracoccus versutus]